MRNFFFLVIILSIVSIFVYFDIFSSQEENELMRHVSEKRAIFISYIELNQYLKGESVIEDKKAIDLMIDRVYQLGFNMIILQVRSFSDAIYPSSIFPWSSTVSSGEGVNPGYDVLKYFLKNAITARVCALPPFTKIGFSFSIRLPKFQIPFGKTR